MDKITRIHLAKTPYEISINAQVALKDYLDKIRGQLDHELADEIMADIEVRITEILSDRKLHRNDVITLKDIDAIQEQLGSPEQFNDDESRGSHTMPGRNEPKKLFRDTDGEYLGGVASGIGAYFAIDPIFIRLIFIALTFISGLGIVLYLLLWLLVPPAKTSSDKLLMRGEPVTAAALQDYRSTTERTIGNLKLRAAVRILYKVCRILLTAAVVVFILALLSSLGFASSVLYTQPLHQLYVAYHLNYLLLALVWLFTMAVVGLLIILLLRLWRQRSGSLKLAFFTLLGVLAVTLVGIMITSPFIVSHYNNQYGGNKLDLALPVHTATTVTPTSLNVQADSDLVVAYVITSQPLHATYHAYPGMGQPDLSIMNKNGVISVQASQLSKIVPDCVLNWCQHIYLPLHVTIYGPALHKYTDNGGAELDLDSLVQTNLSLVAQNNSNLYIDNSYSDNFTMSAESGASIDASDDTAQIATVAVQSNSTVFAPASSSLNATLPLNCDQTLLLLAQTPTSITVNGQTVTTQTFSQNSCVAVDSSPPFPDGPAPVGVKLHRHFHMYKIGSW